MEALQQQEATVGLPANRRRCHAGNSYFFSLAVAEARKRRLRRFLRRDTAYSPRIQVAAARGQQASTNEAEGGAMRCG